MSLPLYYIWLNLHGSKKRVNLNCRCSLLLLNIYRVQHLNRGTFRPQPRLIDYRSIDRLFDWLLIDIFFLWNQLRGYYLQDALELLFVLHLMSLQLCYILLNLHGSKKRVNLNCRWSLLLQNMYTVQHVNRGIFRQQMTLQIMTIDQNEAL